MKPPTGGRGASAACLSASKRRLVVEPPALVVVQSSTVAPTPGSNRPRSTNGSPIGSSEFGLSLSSATPASSPGATATDAASLPSGGDPNGGGNGNNSGGQQRTDVVDAIIIEGDEPVIDQEEDDEDGPCGKRQKRCTSDVWQHFTKKTVVIEDNGKTYVQKWAHCNFPKCKHKGRCESNYGTSGFWSHLRVSHSLLKGQQQLIVEKDKGKDLL